MNLFIWIFMIISVVPFVFSCMAGCFVSFINLFTWVIFLIFMAGVCVWACVLWLP